MATVWHQEEWTVFCNVEHMGWAADPARLENEIRAVIPEGQDQNGREHDRKNFVCVILRVFFGVIDTTFS